MGGISTYGSPFVQDVGERHGLGWVGKAAMVEWPNWAHDLWKNGISGVGA